MLTLIRSYEEDRADRHDWLVVKRDAGWWTDYDLAIWCNWYKRRLSPEPPHVIYVRATGAQLADSVARTVMDGLDYVDGCYPYPDQL